MAREKRAPAAPPEMQNDALADFCELLEKRWPNALIKRFVMPSSVGECREVFMRELTSKDEIQAAIWADATMSPIEKASHRLAADAERRESIRIAIVGIGERVGGRRAADDAPVAYRMVNHDGVPFDEPTNWTTKAWAALSTYFGEVNGVPMDELASGLQEARTVGAFASPTSETRASADRGR